MKSPVYTDGEGASVYSGFTGGAVPNPTKLSMNARAFQTFRYTIVFFEPTETIFTPQKNVSKYFCYLLRTKAFSVLFYFNYYRPQTKLREGYVFTSVCDSAHGGGGIPACLHVSRPTPKWELVGSGRGGGCLQVHTWGVSPGPHSGGLQAHTGGVSRPTPGVDPGHTQGCIPACTEADPPG